MPNKPGACWLVIRYMSEIGHPLAWQPVIVCDHEQQAQAIAASLGVCVRQFDGVSVPVGSVKKLPLLITLGEN
jgi:hypothetical protein